MKGFSSTDQYIATDELIEAVNASITLEKPLLIKGEPGTGKTKLAEEIALKFNTDLIKWNIKSTTKAHQGLYEYDAVSRLRDSQLGDKKVNDIANYIKKELMILPYGENMTRYPIFRISEKYLYVPKYYGIKKIG